MMRWAIIVRVLILFFICTGSGAACTSFCMDTPDGPVFGYNLDLFIPADGLVFVNQRGVAKSGFPSQSGTTGRTLEWVSKYGSITFNLVGREWANTGMNEAGLVISNMQLLASEYPDRDERPALPIGPWSQYVLDTCATVEEAIRVAESVRIEDDTPPVHYLVADADGNCAAMEWLDGEFVCRTGEDLPVKAMSNMPYDRALAAFKRGGPRWWWSNPGRSAQRVADAHNRCIAYDPQRDPDAVTYAFGTLVDSVAAAHTKWSIVYDIAGREVWYGTVVSRPVKHISFENLNFACTEPFVMLDINAAVEGDVDDAFVPYDAAENRSAFATFCERYGVDLTPDAIDGIMQHLAGFACTD